MQLRAGPASSEGEHVRAYNIQVATGVRPADLIDNYQIRRGCGVDVMQVQVTTMTVSLPGDNIGAKGG